jgi:arginine utilization protein RocB
MIDKNWFDTVRSYTERLVRIRSVSPGAGEIHVAQAVLDLLREGDPGFAYTASGLDPLENDPYGRQNVYAFLHGSSSATVILLGHLDTVDTQDYGELEQWALDPTEMTSRSNLLLPEDEHHPDSDDWMFGRGAADMKSGLAVNIALIRHFAQSARPAPFPLSLLMLATPDEENESAGVLQAVRFLSRLQAQYNLHYLGVLNTDYVTSLYPGDPHRYIYAGTIGKLLPGFLCIGRESHAGLPFRGLDANLLSAELIRDLSMNDALCDAAPGQLAAPPVTLHATDLKSHYDVQLPFAAYFYINIFTLQTTPQQLLERLRERAQVVLTQLLQRIDATEQRWQQASNMRREHKPFQPRSGAVFTYAELYAETIQRIGKKSVDAALMQEWAQWPATQDRRERCLRLVYRLWTLSNRRGPAIIIYYSPPYYPAVPPVSGPLQDAVNAVIAAHSDIQLALRPYFPYLSDMSYLHLASDLDISFVQANMPVWQGPDQEPLPGAYYLPLAEMQHFQLPVINWGPFGRGAHQRDEAVLMSYTFAQLPQLLYETLLHLAGAQKQT